ncbi:MAG TPA: DNA-3-methyladenine glycosylase I [Woeseiaceae bacterium]
MKDFEKRGFRFLGPTGVYAFVRSTGVVNDHTTDCFRHEQILLLSASR